VSLKDYISRREQLARQISGQRRDLAEAYRDLGKPIAYTQAGIKGVQILKQNAWLIALAPSAIGIVTGLLNLRKKDDAPKRGLFDFWKKKAPAAEEEAAEIEAQAGQRARPLLRRLIGHGVTAFKVYRRVRPYIPL
jgi:hypothetical protein